MILSAKQDYTLDEFIAFLESEFHLYADNGYISEHIIKPVLMKCAEEFGYRLHQSRTCKITVKDSMAPMPEDLWKIENMFTLRTCETKESIDPLRGIFQGFHFGNPRALNKSLQDRITYLGIIPKKVCCCNKQSCPGDCCPPNHVSVYNIPKETLTTYSKYCKKLRFTDKLTNKCSDYSVCSSSDGDYTVDVIDQNFRFSFEDGEIFLSYLGSLVNDEGEMIIPSHPLIFPYFEWSAKQKILEYIYFNSEGDVMQKIQFAEQRRTGAKYDAMNFLLSPTELQIENNYKRNKMEFYNKWYKMFN